MSLPVTQTTQTPVAATEEISHLENKLMFLTPAANLNADT